MGIELIGFIVIFVIGGLAVCSALYIHCIQKQREEEVYLVNDTD